MFKVLCLVVVVVAIIMELQPSESKTIDGTKNK